MKVRALNLTLRLVVSRLISLQTAKQVIEQKGVTERAMVIVPCER